MEVCNLASPPSSPVHTHNSCILPMWNVVVCFLFFSLNIITAEILLLQILHYFSFKGEHYRGYGTVLYGQHRRYLPPDHPMRKETWGHFGKEERTPPEARNVVEFLANGRLVQDLLLQIHMEEDDNQRKILNKELVKVMKETGKKGLEEFARLPEYDKMQIPVDPMHTVQVIINFTSSAPRQDLASPFLVKMRTWYHFVASKSDSVVTKPCKSSKLNPLVTQFFKIMP